MKTNLTTSVSTYCKNKINAISSFRLAKETQMQNRLKQLPLNVQKRVYEIAGMAGTVCPDVGLKKGLTRFAEEISVRQNTTKQWEPSYSQHLKNYTIFFMTTPNTILNTVSAGMI
jgi:hypothetical protein